MRVSRIIYCLYTSQCVLESGDTACFQGKTGKKFEAFVNEGEAFRQAIYGVFTMESFKRTCEGTYGASMESYQADPIIAKLCVRLYEMAAKSSNPLRVVDSRNLANLFWNLRAAIGDDRIDPESKQPINGEQKAIQICLAFIINGGTIDLFSDYCRTYLGIKYAYVSKASMTKPETVSAMNSSRYGGALLSLANGGSPAKSEQTVAPDIEAQEQAAASQTL